MFRRRYTVQAFHPAEYAPFRSHKFRTMEQVMDFVDLIRGSYPATEIQVHDRKDNRVVVSYPPRYGVSGGPLWWPHGG